MRFRTLWTALADGEPGVVLGVSLLVAVLVGAGLLIGYQTRPPRNVAVDPDHPTVWQLMRQQPRTHDEWLRQRVEAYRAECRSKAMRGPLHLIGERTVEDQLSGLVNTDDWPTAADHAAAVAQSDDAVPRLQHLGAAPGESRPAGGTVAGRVPTQSLPHARIQRHCRPQVGLWGQIPA